MKAYWDILRELREDHDLTQAQVAAVIGTTQQVYYRYEKGINELPLHHLQTLCACLLYTSPSPRDQRGSRMPSSA